MAHKWLFCVLSAKGYPICSVLRLMIAQYGFTAVDNFCVLYSDINLQLDLKIQLVNGKLWISVPLVQSKWVIIKLMGSVLIRISTNVNVWECPGEETAEHCKIFPPCPLQEASQFLFLRSSPFLEQMSNGLNSVCLHEKSNNTGA